MSDYSALAELTKSRLREFYREPGAVFWVFGFPMLMVVVLGLAFRNAPEPKPQVSIVEGTPAWVEPAIAEVADSSRVTPEQAHERLRSGKADLTLRAGSGPDGLSYEFDPERPESRMARERVDDALQRARGRRDVVVTEDRAITEPGARYVDFLLPGIIGLNLMGSSMWGIGYSVVLARKRRMLRRFAATPLRRTHFMAAYMLSRLVFLTAELAFLVIFGRIVFDVAIQGSIVSYSLVAVLGAVCFAGVSLLIAARVQSLEAANGWLNFIQLPMWLLSGSFFTYERFPDEMLPFIRLLPLTALNDALRAIGNEGASLLATAPQLAVLGVWAVGAFFVALRWFRWQ